MLLLMSYHITKTTNTSQIIMKKLNVTISYITESFINQNILHTNVKMTVIFISHSLHNYNYYHCKPLSHIKLSNILQHYHINHYVLHYLITIFHHVFLNCCNTLYCHIKHFITVLPVFTPMYSL